MNQKSRIEPWNDMQVRRLAYEVLDHSPTQEDVERFFRRVARMLNLWGLTVSGITTDGSPLYPDAIKNVWPKAGHQICEFHVIKEITKDVLRVVAKLRKSLDAKTSSGSTAVLARIAC